MLIMPESFKLVKNRAWTQEEHHMKERFFDHGQEASGPSCKYGMWHHSHSSKKVSHTLAVDAPLLKELPIFLFLPITAAAPCRTQLGPAGASSLPQGTAGPSCRDGGAS